MVKKSCLFSVTAVCFSSNVIDTLKVMTLYRFPIFIDEKEREKNVLPFQEFDF